MGQLFPSDTSTQVITQTPPLNTYQAITYYPLAICPAVKVPFHFIISKTYTE